MGGIRELRRCALVACLAGVSLVAACGLASAHAGVEELERETRALVERRPEDPQAYLQRARVLQLARQWDAALGALEAASTRGANGDEVAATRGAILLDAGRPLAALREFDRLLTRQPDASGILFERGRAYLALGDADTAIRDFERAIDLSPAPQPEQIILQRDALLSLGRRAEAVAALDRGMRRIGRVASLQLAAIDLEVDLGRSGAALRRVDELLARRNPNPAWIARRGEILERAGRRQEARAEYTRALSLIDGRYGTRRAQAFGALRRRLETALASLQEGGVGQ
jgi:tetratricopeptide (TPR) repeat protein